MPVRKQLLMCCFLAFSLGGLLWKVSINRVQTKENLRKRGVIQTCTECRCVFCKASEETTTHVFYSCIFSWRVWMLCYNWLGVDSTLPEDCRAHFAQHAHVIASSKNQWWSTEVWSIWKHRTRSSSKEVQRMYRGLWS